MCFVFVSCFFLLTLLIRRFLDFSCPKNKWQISEFGFDKTKAPRAALEYMQERIWTEAGLIAGASRSGADPNGGSTPIYFPSISLSESGGCRASSGSTAPHRGAVQTALEAKRLSGGTKTRAGCEPCKEDVRHRNGLTSTADPTFREKNPKINRGVFLGFGYWIVAEFGVRLAYRVSVASDFSFYDFTHLRDMTGMAKPTVVSKDGSFATVPPHFGFGTQPQRGRQSFLC